MILKAEHSLSYKYSDYVNLNPHYFYLSPKVNPFQSLLKSELLVLPQPDKLIKNIDQEGNIQHVCFENTPLKLFEVVSKFEIESNEFNTFDFIFFPFEAARLPFNYPGYLHKYADAVFSIKSISSEVKALGQHLAEKTNFDTIDFLMEITSYIPANFRYISRERGEAQSSVETLAYGTGSCRDFSVLMIDICASQRLLARFVSGYLFGSDRHMHDLHAWVEVFLPGGGWRGFDPTEGKVIDENYIALANSFEATGLSPIRGTFRSEQKVDSSLETMININKIN